MYESSAGPSDVGSGGQTLPAMCAEIPKRVRRMPRPVPDEHALDPSSNRLPEADSPLSESACWEGYPCAATLRGRFTMRLGWH
jgi:hypothetical protein